MLVPLEKSKERCELLCISLQMLDGEGSAIVSSSVRARAVLSPADPEVQSRRPVFGEARLVPGEAAPPSCWRHRRVWVAAPCGEPLGAV